MGDNSYGGFYFLVDNDRVARVQGYDTEDTFTESSSTINLYLTAGQLVRIENHESTTVWGTDTEGFMHSWFSGYLLFAL